MTHRPARRTRLPRRTLAARTVGVSALLLLAACTAPPPLDSGFVPQTTVRVSGPVTVFAADSLREPFGKLGAEFEKRNPGAEVTFRYGDSAGLATSITGGAPADVFAATGPGTMETLTDQDLTAGPPATFVRNEIQIATLPGNPQGIVSLADLARPGVKVALCDETAPCGAAAQRILTPNGVTVAQPTYAPDGERALAEVRRREADAALVHRTDIRASGGTVVGLTFPESAPAIDNLPIARLKHAPHAEAAQAFVDFVRFPDGRKILTDAGYLAP
ncbi:molybdate ABC transporter substrate-binding protein [Streptomyces sp. B93]|uniref:molybdate ABC transporter substrate-binding protein n=1 Tax=Streptomyces sp. B93 TaxID=2824875 RepID=UPI001B36F5CC|nr:molybdate ABC transporter substrate-binding protein [Streptomyces sp. B93]MBQ1093423.1 molybdate ABC transporter substrate-binding protein [Streptomyces sp. B93]